MTPGSAYWNQRFVLASSRERLLSLHAAVGQANDMRTYQFAQLFAVAMEFRPELILELGRGQGNSTCAFTEAANQMGPASCRVISICRSPSWETERPPAISAVVPDAWFLPLTTHSGNILDFDYESLLAGGRRVLVFWDAHGYDIAECVLGTILPLLAEREHIVLMHDLSDARYLNPKEREYGERRLWRRNNQAGERVRLGHIDSAVEQAVAIVDFVSRNDLVLHSADESIQRELVANGNSLAALKETLGPELFARQAHWFWFSCSEARGPLTFPARRKPPDPIEPSEDKRPLGLMERLRLAARVLFRGTT